MTHRVVLDTNVVLSGLLFPGGRISWIRRAWMSGACRPLVSKGTIEELLRALSYPKFGLEPEEAQELLGEYLPYVEAIDASSAPADLPGCSDPDDQKFLELAAIGAADFLVSGDRALLALEGQLSFRVITPAAAKPLLMGAEPDPAR